MRVDPANHILGLRVNTWVSGIVCVAGLVWFWLSQKRAAASEEARADTRPHDGRAEEPRPIARLGSDCGQRRP